MPSFKEALRAFVASLRIPESRRQLVEIELLDHVESRIAPAVAHGEDPIQAEQNAFAALGDLEQLRASLERIEAAFDIDPLRAMARGLASSVVASIAFVVAGALFPRGSGIAGDLNVLSIAAGSIAALCGLFVIWILAPRGIGAAIRSEAHASIQPSIRPNPRRFAVKAYLGSVLLVPFAVWPAWFFLGLPEVVRDDVLWPTSFLALSYGLYGLHLMRGARTERALVRAAHGS